MVSPNQTHLKHEHMPPSRYWANQDGVQDLVVFFTLCRAHVDDFPLKVYKEKKSYLCILTLLKHMDSLFFLIFFIYLGFAKIALFFAKENAKDCKYAHKIAYTRAKLMSLIYSYKGN